jgi:hypothetical protein
LRVNIIKAKSCGSSGIAADREIRGDERARPGDLEKIQLDFAGPGCYNNLGYPKLFIRVNYEN